MPSSKTWPHDDRPDYILRGNARRTVEAEAMGDTPQTSIACAILSQHYAALAAMVLLKQVLDDYIDGVKP